jgi:hypothetical protein
VDLLALVDALVAALANQSGLSVGAWKEAIRSEVGDSWGRAEGSDRRWGFFARNGAVWAEERFEVVHTVVDPTRQLSPAELRDLGLPGVEGDVVGLPSREADLDVLADLAERAVLRLAQSKGRDGATEDVEEVFRRFPVARDRELVLFSVYKYLRVVEAAHSDGEIALEDALEQGDAEIGELLALRDHALTRALIVALFTTLDEPILRPGGA